MEQKANQTPSESKKAKEQPLNQEQEEERESDKGKTSGYGKSAPSTDVSSGKSTSSTFYDDFFGSPEGEMTIKDMEDHLSIVQVLEKERREWHAERAKLTHCIHLQQVELASRSSAAQETAALIAKEFARVIEGFEERLLKVETDNERVIGDRWWLSS